MVTVIDINRLLGSGESQTVEFKTSFGRETIETLGAFANAQGRSVLVGVADDALVKGVTLGKETLNDWLGQINQPPVPRLSPISTLSRWREKTSSSFASMNIL